MLFSWNDSATFWRFLMVFFYFQLPGLLTELIYRILNFIWASLVPEVHLCGCAILLLVPFFVRSKTHGIKQIHPNWSYYYYMHIRWVSMKNSILFCGWCFKLCALLASLFCSWWEAFPLSSFSFPNLALEDINSSSRCIFREILTVRNYSL